MGDDIETAAARRRDQADEDARQWNRPLESVYTHTDEGDPDEDREATVIHAR